MNLDRPNRATARDSAVRHASARCSDLWILGAPAFALAATPLLAFANTPGDWIGAVWLVAVLWTIAASLAQALWAGVRHGDWSAFSCSMFPGDDDDFDYFSRTGSYAYLRIRAAHEALTREGDPVFGDSDHSGSLR